MLLARFCMSYIAVMSCAMYLSDLEPDILISDLPHHCGLVWWRELFDKPEFLQQKCAALLAWVLCGCTACQWVWGCLWQSCCCPQLLTHLLMRSSPFLVLSEVCGEYLPFLYFTQYIFIRVQFWRGWGCFWFGLVFWFGLFFFSLRVLFCFFFLLWWWFCFVVDCSWIDFVGC